MTECRNCKNKITKCERECHCTGFVHNVNGKHFCPDNRTIAWPEPQRSAA